MLLSCFFFPCFWGKRFLLTLPIAQTKQRYPYASGDLLKDQGSSKIFGERSYEAFAMNAVILQMAISSWDGVKGVLVDAYGVYAESLNWVICPYYIAFAMFFNRGVCSYNLLLSDCGNKSIKF